MSTLGELAQVLRSKNAGPFLITIDVMFDSMETFQYVASSGALTPAAVAERYGLPAEDVRVVDYPRAKAIKITLPRLWGKRGAGSPGDRDVYGAQQHAPLLSLAIPNPNHHARTPLMLETVLATARDDFERHVARLQRYIRQKSISAENTGNDEMAAMLAADINALGGVGRVVPGIDFPIVYGRFDVGAPRTVLIHSMYDTTPADEPGWTVDPFEAVRADFESYGECIVARGAEDTKGPVAAIFGMIESHNRAKVRLPVNLILLFEASELGSKSLPAFVESHADELRHAHVAYWPWLTQQADGTTAAWLGAKGLMTFKLRVRGADWGGPAKRDIHGLHASWIASPAQRLVAALASLKTTNDLDVAIEGFYGDGDPITAEDEQLVQELAKRVDASALARELGVARFKQDSFADAIRAHCFQSELNISGLRSGYVIEDGHKVVLSHEATASLDLRPLDGMTVPQVTSALRRHFDKHGFNEVEIEVLNGYVGGRLPVSNWAVQELLGAYRDCGFDPNVWPRTATAIAVELFTKQLGMPWIATCPGHAGRKHSANEYLQLSSYRSTVPFMCRLMWRIAKSPEIGLS